MLQDLLQKYSRIEGVYQKYKSDRDSLRQEIDKLQHEVEILTESSAIMKKLMQKLMAEDVSTIESLITDGLQAIFEDQDLQFKSFPSIKNNKVSIEFSLCHNGIEGDILDSFGGGVANVVSLLLRFITIMKLKLYPMIALDESLSAVSESYIDNTAQFIKSLCEKTGFDLLLVTHQPRFLDFSNLAYSGDLTDKGLMLEKVK